MLHNCGLVPKVAILQGCAVVYSWPLFGLNFSRRQPGVRKVTIQGLLSMYACMFILHLRIFFLHLKDVFILDTKQALHVWIGKDTSTNERKNAMAYAHVSIDHSIIVK